MNKSRLMSIFRIVITLGLVTWLVLTQNFASVFEQLKNVRLVYIIAAFGCVLLVYVFLTTRWVLLLGTRGSNVSWLELFKVYLIGSFFNIFLFTGLGGDVVRIWLSGNLKDDHAHSTASVVVERIMGIAATLVLLFFGGWVHLSSLDGKDYRIYAYFFAAAIVIFFLLVFSRRTFNLISKILQKVKLFGLGKILNNFFEALHHYRYSPGRVVGAFIFSLLAQSTFVILHFAAARCLSILDGFDLKIFWVIWPLMAMSNFIPSFGGHGVREFGYVFLFGLFNVTEDTGLSFALIIDIVFFTLSFIGGILLILNRKIYNFSELTDKAKDGTSQLDN